MKLLAALAVLTVFVLPSTASAATCKGEPVVLVHGTFGDASNWGYIAPQLQQAGYCTFALNYGNHATGDIPASAQQLKTFVDGVLAQTGASKVDIVGHSQGGMMPRYYIEHLGGGSKVDDLIGLAPSNHGTTLPLANTNDQSFCAACAQQAAGSPFITALNAGDETPGSVDYTVVETTHDEVVTPYTSAFLDGATNITLQAKCLHDVSEHLTIITDQTVVQWIENALGRSGPADPNFTPKCL